MKRREGAAWSDRARNVHNFDACTDGASAGSENGTPRRKGREILIELIRGMGRFAGKKETRWNNKGLHESGL